MKRYVLTFTEAELTALIGMGAYALEVSQEFSEAMPPARLLTHERVLTRLRRADASHIRREA